jgi:Spy/CpxP family protein refolding chaperone
MKKKIPALAIFLALFFLIPDCGAVDKVPGAERNLLPQWWERPAVIRKLGLSERQASRIREIRSEERGHISRQREELIRQRLDLENLLVQSRIDEERTGRRIEAVQNAVSNLAGAEIGMFVRMLQELSQEQRRQLIALIHRWETKTTKKSKAKKSAQERRYNRF